MREDHIRAGAWVELLMDILPCHLILDEELWPQRFAEVVVQRADAGEQGVGSNGASSLLG